MVLPVCFCPGPDLPPPGRQTGCREPPTPDGDWQRLSEAGRQNDPGTRMAGRLISVTVGTRSLRAYGRGGPAPAGDAYHPYVSLHGQASIELDNLKIWMGEAEDTE